MSLPLFAVFGAGGCGRGVMPLARAQLLREGIPATQLVFVDDLPGREEINGHRILKYEQFLRSEAGSKHVVIAIADGKIREKLSQRCSSDGVQPWTIRAANAVIMDNVLLGAGAAISPFVTLTSNIRVGAHFHANLYSYVEHDCVIGSFVTFAPGVMCNGNVHIEDHSYIGAGAVIKQGRPDRPLFIGRGAVIGMGAVVTRDVPAGATVVGNPARPFLKRDASC